MSNAENMLVLTSIVFAIAITSIASLHTPRANFKQWYFGEKVRFDRSRLTPYITLLILTLLASGIYGFAVTKNVILIIEFAAFNLVVAAIAGINLVLYRKREDN